MDAVKLIASIPELAKNEDWITIKRRGTVVVKHDDKLVVVVLAAQATEVGRLRHFVCPRCGRRCRDLFGGNELGCRRCLRVRHPDQLLSGSRWNRKVMLPVRQIARIDQRLQQRGLDRNYRRRLRRRRKNLMTKVENELVQRQLNLRAALELASLRPI